MRSPIGSRSKLGQRREDAEHEADRPRLVVRRLGAGNRWLKSAATPSAGAALRLALPLFRKREPLLRERFKKAYIRAYGHHYTAL